MAIGFKNLFGSGSLPPEITGELRTTLLQMRHERTALETLATQVRETLGGAERLGPSVKQMQAAVDELRAKVDALDAATPRVNGLDERLGGLEARLEGAMQSADAVRGDVATATTDARAAHADLASLRQEIGDVATIRETVAEVLAMRNELASAREDLAALEAQAGSFGRTRDDLRSQYETMAAENRAARSQLQQTVERFTTLQADVAETTQRVGSLRETIDPVAELVRGVPEAKRDLQMLQALREFVARKLAGVEAQRDLVERVDERGERLELVLQRLETEVQRHTEYHVALSEMRERMTALAAEHATLEESCGRIRAAHDALRGQEEAARTDVQAMRAQLAADVEHAVSRLTLEREGLDTVSERVATLRSALVEAEQRFTGLEAASVLVDEVRTDIGHLRELVAEIERDVSALAVQGERVRDVEQRVGPLEQATTALSARLDAVREPSEAAIARAEARLRELTVQVEVLEGRADHLDGTASAIRELGQEIERQRLAVEGSLVDLQRAAELKADAGSVVQELAQRTETLAAALRSAEEGLAETRQAAGQLDRRAEELAVSAAAMDRFEERLREWKAMEGRLGRAMAQAAERHDVVLALRTDLHRMFAVAEETAEQVRATAAARAELEAGRVLVGDLVPRLQAARIEADRLAERQDSLADHDALLARIEAALCDVRSSLQTLEDQRAFLDQVVSTAGALRFQSRQAESLIEALEEGWKRARA